MTNSADTAGCRGLQLPWEVSHLLHYRVRAPVVSLSREQLVGFFFLVFPYKKSISLLFCKRIKN